MERILASWIGFTDIRASKGSETDGLGPIGQAVGARTFDEICLISDLPVDEAGHFVHWLGTLTQTPIVLRPEKLTGPTRFGEIYESAVRMVTDIHSRHGKDASLTFHLSPGTPAMAAVWIILAKTRFPAELLESSRQEGVQTVCLPFDISAEFIPDLLARQDNRLERLAEGLPPEAPEFAHLVHRSDAMKRVILKARHVAARSVPVLIEGETGTGKELLARAIHQASPRRNRPFIPVNCGAIPAELMESELFGHEKGAFTGADRQKSGYFEAADRGTLFLDEIGELPLDLQPKLLRVLENGEFQRIGETQARHSSARIITATNRDLKKEVREGRFRADLYHRLSVFTVAIPALRDLGDDRIRLLEHFRAIYAAQANLSRFWLTTEATTRLLAYRFPGNVRELRNIAIRLTTKHAGKEVGVDDLEAELDLGNESPVAGVLPAPTLAGQAELVAIALNDIRNRHDFDLDATLHRWEEAYIEAAQQLAHNNMSQAARLLGINRTTLYNRIDTLAKEKRTIAQ